MIAMLLLFLTTYNYTSYKGRLCSESLPCGFLVINMSKQWLWHFSSLSLPLFVSNLSLFVSVCLCLSLIALVYSGLHPPRNSRSSTAGSPWFGAGCWITAMLPWGSIYYAWRMNNLTRRLIFKNTSTRRVRRYEKSKHIVFVWFILHSERIFQLCSRLKICMCYCVLFLSSKICPTLLLAYPLVWSELSEFPVVKVILRNLVNLASAYRPGMLSVLSWVSSPWNFV